MKDLILGVHIWFARDGATIDGDVVDAATLHDFATTEDEWLQLPSVEAFEPRFNKQVVKRRSPVAGGGRFGVRKTIPISTELTYAFDVQEWSKLLFELLFGAASIASPSGEFKPGTMTEPVAGWLYLKGYGQEDELILDGPARVELTVEPHKFGENLNPHALLAEIIVGNELNDHALTNLT
ncbi:MAG: hypothetical protein MUF31_16725 [Akkermansiaceae bacterium]|jgi:hypothetical protein|nr:hypothetical protein [Akkermansiaceae bacterium]